VVIGECCGVVSSLDLNDIGVFAVDRIPPSKFQLVRLIHLIVVDSNCACKETRRMIIVCQLIGAVSVCASTLCLELVETKLEL
jgi:hypothetical protein